MSGQSDLEKRLKFFGIDSNTKRAINNFLPVLLPEMESIADRFYGYTLNFPDAQAILSPFYSNNTLRDRQVKHWTKLFSCRFNKKFYEYSINIGKIHYNNKVYPYLYIGSYNFIQCEIMHLASNYYLESSRRNSVLTAINQLISLDMDLALSAYTREHWLRSGRSESTESAPREKLDVHFIR